MAANDTQQASSPAGTDERVRQRQVWLTILIVALSIWVALEFLTPIAWAAVLAIAQWPLFRRALARYPERAGLLAFAFTAATALLVILPLSLAAVSLAKESDTALAWLNHAQQSGIQMPTWLPALPLLGSRLASYWQQHLGTPQAAHTLLGTVSAASVISWTRSIGSEVARESALFLITLLALVSLLARGQQIAEKTRVIAIGMFGNFGADFVQRIAGAVRATVNGTIMVSVLEGSILGVGYAVAGVPQPLLFATFTMILALIPFGAWAAFGLASLILMGTDHILAGGLLFAFGAVVMTVGDNVVQPSIIGSAVELPFLMALVGAFGGLAEMGLVGLFVGPVIMAALLLVAREWLEQAPVRPSPN
ncbi:MULTISPECIES: AI-2E family transporter [unclassified Novosphingobium]|uniref:AI-2E family transporter n=1 Tax=unclassified Novosphingobium TaxID=2644732 RepID=UPI00135AC691|nr:MULTISPECIES: AI-2E family transporter [unclassified Novosphingobium]